MKGSHQIKKTIIVVLFFLLGVFLVQSIFLYVQSTKHIHTIQIPAIAEVGLDWGYRPLNYTDTSILNFSRVLMDQTHIRYMNIANTFEEPVKVIISSDGRISDIMYVGSNNFVLDVNETKKVNISVRAPLINPSVEKDVLEKGGVYDGSVYVSYYRAS